jgi:hypothetical protein
MDDVRVHRFEVEDRADTWQVTQDWQATHHQRDWLSDGDVVVTNHVVAIMVLTHPCAVTTPTCGLGVVTSPWETMGRYARAYTVAAQLAEEARLPLAPIAAPDQSAPVRQRRTQVAAAATVAATATVPELSAAQRKTLTTLVAKGGEVNGYIKQPGIDVRSLAALVTKGLLDYIGTCECWETDGVNPCTVDHGKVDTDWCYERVRINAAGRAAHAAYTGGSS